MRIEDLSDYVRLRRLVENPWEVLRFRKRSRGEQGPAMEHISLELYLGETHAVLESETADEPVAAGE